MSNAELDSLSEDEMSLTPQTSGELQRRAIKGSFWTALYTLIGAPIAFIANAVIARRLGVAHYGDLAFLTVSLAVGVSLFNFGFSGAWSNAESPKTDIGRANWIKLFRTAGYPSPRLPLTVFRGAPTERRAGMAWSKDVDHARHFANRWVLREDVPIPIHRTVLRLSAAVLCDVEAVDRDARDEHEVIGDPENLDEIEEFGQATPYDLM